MNWKIEITRLSSIAVFSIAMLIGTAAGAQDADEEATVTKSSTNMTAAFDRNADIIQKSGIGEKMSTTALGATSGPEFEKRKLAINAELPIANISTGIKDGVYDIIIQPGHYGRQTGKTGAQGSLISERALNSYVVSIIADGLKASKLKVLVVPADGVVDGMKTKVFLSIHADASSKPCTSGPSMAYANDSSLLAMHAVGYGLARSFGYNYKNFMKDNFTVDEAHYYMFSKIDASVMKGLLELGEVTCGDVEKRLIEASDVIGKNLAVSLNYVAAMKDQ